jgi:hypothetical protein
MRNAPIASFCFLLACSTEIAAPTSPEADAPAVEDAGVTEVVIAPAVALTCEERIAERSLPMPSARQLAYAETLPEVLVRTRIDPVLYLSWPDARARSEEATALRSELEASRRPSRELRRLLDSNVDRALLREVILSDGYLFSDRPALALALSAEVELADLFDTPRLYRSRDGVLDVLDRSEEGYVDADGSVARVRLNDRVTEDESALADPLGLDLEVVREQTGALRTIPTAIGASAAALDLVFPDESRRPALVEIREGRTEVVCIGGSMESLEETLSDAARFWTGHRATVDAARALVDENARFDEPTNEPEGVQEDGHLRLAWTRAYFRGERTFTHREVEYPVFDRQGRAIPPQVCIDFVFDAWERGGGTWYAPRGEAPDRTSGAIDADRAGEIPRRNVTRLVEYAAGEGAVLHRYDVPRENRVALAEGREYARAIARSADAFREGDALVIYGLRLQDMRNHHHAILVIRTEPMTGVPMVVADNQTRPRFRTLAGAMQAAPLRSIHQRLRLDVAALAR